MDAAPATRAVPIARRELTLRVVAVAVAVAVAVGIVLSIVMGAANVYVGLKAGMTVSASIPAAVMAMLLFKLLFNNSSILEANQVQTCASAGEQWFSADSHPWSASATGWCPRSGNWVVT